MMVSRSFLDEVDLARHVYILISGNTACSLFIHWNIKNLLGSFGLSSKYRGDGLNISFRVGVNEKLKTSFTASKPIFSSPWISGTKAKKKKKKLYHSSQALNILILQKNVFWKHIIITTIIIIVIIIILILILIIIIIIIVYRPSNTWFQLCWGSFMMKKTHQNHHHHHHYHHHLNHPCHSVSAPTCCRLCLRSFGRMTIISLTEWHRVLGFVRRLVRDTGEKHCEISNFQAISC